MINDADCRRSALGLLEEKVLPSQSEDSQLKLVQRITIYIVFENCNYLYLCAALLASLAVAKRPGSILLLDKHTKSTWAPPEKYVQVQLPLALLTKQNPYTGQHSRQEPQKTKHWKHICKCRGNIFLLTLAVVVQSLVTVPWLTPPSQHQTSGDLDPYCWPSCDQSRSLFWTCCVSGFFFLP